MTQVKKDAPTNSIAIQQSQAPPKFQTILVERFRNKLKQRGSRGMIGLQR